MNKHRFVWHDLNTKEVTVPPTDIPNVGRFACCSIRSTHRSP